MLLVFYFPYIDLQDVDLIKKIIKPVYIEKSDLNFLIDTPDIPIGSRPSNSENTLPLDITLDCAIA